MINALRVLVRALRLWWGELFMLTFFNLAWLALLALVITGPPATAAMYVIARRIADGEVIEPRDGWRALRQMLVPAWKWGAVNLMVIVVTASNFWAFQNMTGWTWTALRLLWGFCALLWCAVNLFYWPFWLAETDQRLTNTLRNGLVLLLKSPGLGLTLLVASALLVVSSILTTLPLAVALMAWLSLIGIIGLDAALDPASLNTPGPDTGVEIEVI